MDGCAAGAGSGGAVGAPADQVPSLNAVNGYFALIAASALAGLEPVGAKLIRLGDSALFRLSSAPVVARVSRGLERLADAEREVAVARWLASEGVPAIQALDVDQPVVAEGRVVTFWDSAGDQEAYGTAAEVAALLRQLHALRPPESLGLAPLDPFGRALWRIEHVPGLSDQDRVFLRERHGQLVEAYEHLSFELAPGVIHGDASVGNVIRDRDGRPLFADLDGFAVGPREWDLVLTALYFDRLGWHTADEYAAFVDIYGWDVMAWPGYPVLADIREFLMVCWLSQNADGDPKMAHELARRISDLRTGSSTKGWQPF